MMLGLLQPGPCTKAARAMRILLGKRVFTGGPEYEPATRQTRWLSLHNGALSGSRPEQNKIPVPEVVTCHLTADLLEQTGIKETIVEQFRDRFDKVCLDENDGAMIFVSRTLASWIEDDKFMSAILSPIFPSRPDVTVLAAAVDGIPGPHIEDPNTSQFTGRGVRDGVSILRGKRHILFPDEKALPALAAAGDRAAVRLKTLHPFGHHLGRNIICMDATVPLANTVFDNGRNHTMFLSRWSRSKPEAVLALQKLLEVKGIREVPVWGFDPHRRHTRHGKTIGGGVCLPMVELTPRRKIVAGLGNILRQVEVDGAATPASRELEAAIARLINCRKVDAVHVWALLTPADDAHEGLVCKGVKSGLDEEEKMMLRAQDLLALRCQVRKVLSGGGGWGPKQGLLSLDPEVRLGASEQADVEKFVQSLCGDRGAADDLVGRGSFVQFFASQAACATTYADEMVVGTMPADDNGPRPSGLLALTGRFGALSAEGFYLCWGQAGKHATKLDLPGSFVSWRRGA